MRIRPVIQEILRDILRQSLNQGRIDIRATCTQHSLPLDAFKQVLLNHFEISAIEEVGELDLDQGIFYSYVWEGSPELSEGNLTPLIAEFETSGKLNLTTFAQKRQADIDKMKILFFRYCGARNIHGRAEIAPNGDYYVIPAEEIAGDFVKSLDTYIQRIIIAESIHSEKNVQEEGKND